MSGWVKHREETSGYAHAHPPIRNANEVHGDRLTLGDRVADGFARLVGSWGFIITQSIFLVAWMCVNALAAFRHWDPYPFILLNLALSFQAAYSAPIIMMSQNRQNEKDRIAAHIDYETNIRTEEETRVIIELLERQERALTELRAEVAALRAARDGNG